MNTHFGGSREVADVKKSGVNWLDYGARMYDASIGRWHCVDPLAEEYLSQSTYHFAGNNPILNLDNNGMSYNPIYDFEGNFLGTDDKGLQGDAIVMHKDNFEQGMSHDDAMLTGFLANDFADIFTGTPFFESAYNLGVDIESHRSSLESRPDWDGKLALKEANEWYRRNRGKPLYVDAAKIDLSPVSMSDIGAVGDFKYINFAHPGNANFETGLVYGSIKLTLTDSNGGVKLGGKIGYLDEYNFEYQKGRTLRNIATWIGKKVAGDGTKFNIYNYGKGKVNTK